MAKSKVKGTVTGTETTKKPAISDISLSGNTFTVKWTKGETLSGNKAGQEIQCWLNTSAGIKEQVLVKPAINTTSYTYSFTLADYYPNSGKPTIRSFFVMVRNKQTGKNYSEFATREYKIAPPHTPVMADPTWGGSDHSNRSTFSWTTETTEGAPATNVALQTVPKENCPDNIDGLAEWASATVSTYSLNDSDYWDESNLANKSIARCVRIKARGIGGDSAWVSAKYVHAKPKKSENVDANVNVSSTNNTTYVEIGYNAPSDPAHPIDQNTIMYLDTVPGEGMSVPLGATFTEAANVADTANIDRMAVQLAGTIQNDHVLFLQIKSTHGGQSEYSDVRLANLKYKLKIPTGLSVEQNQSNYKATVTATNASDVPDSYLAVYYYQDNEKPFCVGYIAHGQSSAIVQCPNWTGATAVAFGVKAIQGSTPTSTSRGSYSVYSIATINMESDMQTVGGSVPAAPTSTSASQVDDNGTVLVKWNWSWSDATIAEISWADHKDAWESTDEPDTYEVSNMHAAQWRISGLALGSKWYVRVRLGVRNDDVITYGPYCNAMEVDLTAAPKTPVMRLSNRIIRPGGKVTVSWSYASGDGTLQYSAEIFEVLSGPTYKQIATTKTAQHITLDAGALGWNANTQHTICMRVWSDSNRVSAYSATTVITIANPLTCTITTGSGFQTVSGELQLKALPATITVTGAGTQGTTTLVLERAQSYDLETPDEQVHTGYDKETIFLSRYPGQSAITIYKDDLIGRLDDTAPYRIVGTVEDTYGQQAQASLPFTVQWTTQAVMPTGTAVLDEENEIVKITPTAPTGATTGAYVNIYRLSADKPVLIYEGAEFGTTYVDPYPTIGEFGGYRLAYYTANGDFITSDMVPAILDISVPYNIPYHIIDFGKAQVALAYNMTSADKFDKSFQQTRYLGGAVQGDWTAGVVRSGSVSTALIAVTDNAVKAMLRKLAVYSGLCHIRTRAGSNYTANVNVSEDMSYNTAGKVSEFSLEIQGCDNTALDGMKLSDWKELG